MRRAYAYSARGVNEAIQVGATIPSRGTMRILTLNLRAGGGTRIPALVEALVARDADVQRAVIVRVVARRSCERHAGGDGDVVVEHTIKRGSRARADFRHKTFL